MKKSDVFLTVDKHLKSIIPPKCHHLFVPLRKKIAPFFANTLSSIWCVTWQCNFACPYCWQLEDPQKYRIDNTISYGEWLGIWKRISHHFDDITIGITGGEPFLFPNFINLLTELPDNIRYDITSNLSVLDVEEFLPHEKIRKQCLGIACSFHPSNASNPRNYVDVFFEKVRKLAVLSGTKVNFVPVDSNLQFYKTVNEFCDEHGIALHVKKHIALKKPLANAHEGKSVGDDTGSSHARVVTKFDMGEEVSCSAGFSHLALFPNADVWPCYTKGALRENYLGNLLSEEFTFNKEHINCSFYRSCWGVDYHNVNIVRRKKKKALFQIS